MRALLLLLPVVMWVCGCGDDDSTRQQTEAPSQEPEAQPEPEPTAGGDAVSLPTALLVAYGTFEVEGGEVTSRPGPARLDIVRRISGEWSVETLEDPESRVFHKAMLYQPRGAAPGILTLGGAALCGDAEGDERDCDAQLKLWRRSGGTWTSETVWEVDFGGRVNRMRDAEIGNVLGTGVAAIAVATHNQGVVAAITPGAEGFDIRELDRDEDTFVHEIELGDLNNDGAVEVYATPSEPNTLDGEPQPGVVVRYVPSAEGEAAGRTVVAALGDRHAKEIFVHDVDGDGTDELYVSVEAQNREQQVEIRRYDADTPPGEGVVIARIPDRMNRFLTAGDFDGDGKKEMVAAALSSGLWLLRPGRDPRSEWSSESIDRDSSGFEHAALAADLDGDGTDELYVASDNQTELRRYVWRDGRARSEVLHSWDLRGSRMTWNIATAPVRVVVDAPN